MKASSPRRLTLHDIWIHAPGGPPHVTIPLVDTRHMFDEEHERQVAKVSISHDGEYATATVLIDLSHGKANT